LGNSIQQHMKENSKPR